MKKAMQNDDDDEDATPTTSTTVAKGSTALPLTPEEKAIKAAARAAKDAIQQKLDDEKARVREVRVKALVERLRNKISLFTEQASGEDDEVIASGGTSCLLPYSRLQLTPIADGIIYEISSDNVDNRGGRVEGRVVWC